jgi:hypothetical protein
LLQIIKIICEYIFKKFDHIDSKILVLEVKKRVVFVPCKIGLAIFEFSWLKSIALHNVEVFAILFEN